jgi:hypothetical protein
MAVREFIRDKTREEEWNEIKKEPPYFWGLITKRWQWALFGGILLILFIVILLIFFIK